MLKTVVGGFEPETQTLDVTIHPDTKAKQDFHSVFCKQQAAIEGAGGGIAEVRHGGAYRGSGRLLGPWGKSGSGAQAEAANSHQGSIQRTE